MTYELIETNEDILFNNETTQYIFKKAYHPKRWYVNYNKVSNSIHSVICSGS